MGKRQALPSSSDSEESDPAAKRKKEGKKDKEKDSKDKGKHKVEKTDKDRGKEKDKDKKDKDKDKKDKKEKKAERAVEGPTAPPGSSQDKAKKEKKSKDAGPPTKEVFFSGSEAFFNKPTHPFGLELDGGLVVDLADKGGLALAAGVQIGWRVLSVDGNAVSEEEVGLAAEVLRTAEERMAKDGTKVVVRFVTDEPEHWKQASNKLAGRR
mmetsp:Transcript_42371/g.121234  ORF Transcript_42371/g.121234 Transcript_42371/m.121234 type:complete len:210 (-) Transcript_42371:82-711(-)